MKKITYGIHESPLGKMVLGMSEKGVCWLGFMVSRKAGAYKGDGLTRMKAFFPEAAFIEDETATKDMAARVLKAWREDRLADIPLDLRGTDFQISVWQALLKIPKGQVVSYGDVANDIGSPNASRAVGTAVGENPVSLVVPCHRVVQASGKLGNYGWGVGLKEKILKAEGL
ncbi:MAG: methylated-DNA--[protein]-cysteine S-methyltransferase [Rhodospirillales bacterium]|nr:methylated-DNA--[protein]-cysteine S-methyltransferase [Alphaproteobacteria bacterium]USO03628.1 MAG: methylated-DNA--[protein]-cysteine S-methyltransferase [Rhodospirillales bacterium]